MKADGFAVGGKHLRFIFVEKRLKIGGIDG